MSNIFPFFSCPSATSNTSTNQLHVLSNVVIVDSINGGMTSSGKFITYYEEGDIASCPYYYTSNDELTRGRLGEQQRA